MKTGAFIVPTGIGASIGGFAGDASFWARKFASKCKLLVNPNVVNAACFSGITENMLYVEGYSLDEFFRGKISLTPSLNNKIGVIFDKSISKPVLNVHINTMNAVETVYDVKICGYEITEEDVGVEFFIDNSGASMGNVNNLETLKKAAQKLIEKGAEAIAIVCHFPDEQGDNYANGIGVDPVGGVEAIISHYISKEFYIPCAHAPAFSDITISTEIVDKRCSAEYITPTFLPCILLGLSQAPKIQPLTRHFVPPSPTRGERIERQTILDLPPTTRVEGISCHSEEYSDEESRLNCHSEQSEESLKLITVNDVDFLIMPYNALGGIPVLEMIKRGKKVFAVKENESVLNVTPEIFSNKCISVTSYQELLTILD